MSRAYLTEKEIKKLSSVINIHEDVLQNLNERSLLDYAHVRKIIVKYDFDRIRSTGEYTGQQIMKAIAIEYGMTASNVEFIVYNKKSKPKQSCKSCGAIMTNYKFTKNKGLCDNCLSQKLTDVL